MANIISKLYLSKPPLAFPNIIARLLEDSGVDYHALDSGDKVPKGRPITAEVMENIRQPQRHSPPPHQTPQPHQFHEQPFPPSPQYQSQHQEEGEQPAFEAIFEASYEPPKLWMGAITRRYGQYETRLIRPRQPGESSTAPQQQAPPQQAPPEANAPRRENPDSDDE
ncbi:hypothetical protein PIB30_091020 [Stylosanthes scabra]|uniref:Uncharacterized protein n=1 Tax=Stylosanthes scabra TaxID=79078 RepID=A0ABU6QV11_9FABA|nr:hypothetical protein [Stylosanthes scabra]